MSPGTQPRNGSSQEYDRDVVPAFASQLQPYFGSNVIVIDPANPDSAEIGIVRHLKSIDAQQNAKTALLALGTLALGLLILAPADQN
jgi:hypothetical protein